ncbi:MAG: hypothetical protein C4525_13470 [Desulfarculus sp.]|jgi:hypothetical protein|nr:MAG: hypothetical protein C4525_13470 [Desulfarculus sp.]
MVPGGFICGHGVKNDQHLSHGSRHGHHFTFPLFHQAIIVRQLTTKNPEKLRGQNKKFKVAMVACMPKLLVILNAMVRDNKPWQPLPA